MPVSMPTSNKAKIARRVIEVLEFFDDSNPEATVMDIVRRYDRPQSSTSELLSSLVELGLLYKDPQKRSYRPTARAALLGSSGQPEILRDGRVSQLMDRLVAQTGLSVALVGMVGLDAQVVCCRQSISGNRPAVGQLVGGTKSPLSESAAGLLLLSTLDGSRREGLVRRLNAEASEDRKFIPSEMLAEIQTCQDNGHAVGNVGHGTSDRIAAVLLPQPSDGQPLAIGIVHNAEAKVLPDSLLQCIDDAMQLCLPARESATVETLHNAA